MSGYGLLLRLSNKLNFSENLCTQGSSLLQGMVQKFGFMQVKKFNWGPFIDAVL
jgi:hypothetical protein